MNKLPKPKNFWSKVNKIEDEKSCWEWNACRDKKGYGKIGAYGKTFKAHRVSYMYAYENIPDGEVVCHLCDNPSCVRPDHLYAATAQWNNLDKELKNRQVRGSKNGRALLSEDDIVEIRELYKQGVTQTRIAEEFGVGQSAISRIVNRERWLHVGQEDMFGEPKETGKVD